MHKTEVSEKGMGLADFLLYHTDVGSLVWIMRTTQDYNKYQPNHASKPNLHPYLGCTYIDPEDVFIRSLNPDLLKRKVEDYSYFMPDPSSRSPYRWAKRPVLVVYVI